MRGPGFVSVFDDAAKMTEFVIGEWKRISSEAVGERGFFAVALSGGRTPLPLYRALAARRDIGPWDKTHVFLADERFVPVTDADSNNRMIRETLLDAVDIPSSNFHAVPTGLPDAESAAKKYEEKLISFFGLRDDGLPVFDLILLGLGPDGHTASLFPGSSALQEKRRLVDSAVLGDARHDRITLTFPVINSARNVLFLVTGKEKAEALREVAEERNAALPASSVAPGRGRLLFLADQDAASLLSEGRRQMP
jgi:6-phosphogluconolactonase